MLTISEHVHTTGKRSNSAKVFSALSWSWSSKSLQFARDAVQCGSSEPCKPGAHCITLDKLYVAEKKLYKEVKVRVILSLDIALILEVYLIVVSPSISCYLWIHSFMYYIYGFGGNSRIFSVPGW